MPRPTSSLRGVGEGSPCPYRADGLPEETGNFHEPNGEEYSTMKSNELLTHTGKTLR